MCLAFVFFGQVGACGGEGLTPHHPKPAASYEYIVDFIVQTVCRVFKSRQEEWENM